MNFKVWSTMQGYKLPDIDQEILRNLYAKNWDHQEAYEALKFKINYQKQNFPMAINDNIQSLLNSGGLYIFGRDKNLRPIFVLNM